jgi:hypothetical protein
MVRILVTGTTGPSAAKLYTSWPPRYKRPRPCAKSGCGPFTRGGDGLRRPHPPRNTQWMFGRHRYRLPGLDGSRRSCCSRSAADCEAHPAYCISIGSAQNAASFLSAAQSGSSVGRANRAAHRDLGTSMDIPAARNDGRKRSATVGTVDSRRRRGPLPYLDAPTAPTDERDSAAVAVGALCAEGHAGCGICSHWPRIPDPIRRVVPDWPRAWPLAVHRADVAGEARLEWLPTRPPSVVDMLLDARRAGVGQPAFITSIFAEPTGVRPRTFLEWATDHADKFSGVAGPWAPATVRNKWFTE